MADTSSIISTLGRVVDSALLPFFPGYALRRMQNRAMAEYLRTFHEAARKDRTTHDWPDERMSADQAILPEMDTVNARARHQVANDWSGQAAKKAMRRHTIGIGITPKAAAVHPRTGKLFTEHNAARDRLWKHWADRPRLCDVEGRKSLLELVGLTFDEFKTVGNGFLVWSYRRMPHQVGLQVQAFEVEQLARGLHDSMKPASGNEIRQGVEVNRFGRPEAYWVHLDRHPLDGALYPGGSFNIFDTEPQRIPAERVLHLHRQTRPRETLPPSAYAPVLSKMFGAKRYDDKELIAKGMEAFLAFAIKQNPEFGTGLGFGYDANASNGSTSTPQDAGGARELRWEPGRIPVLFPKEEIQMFNPQRPGAQYPGYMEMQAAMMGAGLGISRSNLLRIFTGAYVSERMGLLETWKEVEPDQLLAISQILLPLWELFGTFAILEHRIPAPQFLDDPMVMAGYHLADWQPPPREEVDPARTAAANKINIDYRLTPRQGIRNKQGGDVREDFAQIEAERADAESRGIRLPEDQAGGPGVSPSEPKAHGSGDEEAEEGEAPRHQSTADDMADAIILEALREAI